MPNTSLGGGPHNTRYLPRVASLLRQDQLAEARRTKLVRLAVMHDADVSMTLQQRITAHDPFRRLARAGGALRGGFRGGCGRRRRFRAAG